MKSLKYQAKMLILLSIITTNCLIKDQAKMIILLSIITTYNLIKVLYIWMNLTKKIFRFFKFFFYTKV